MLQILQNLLGNAIRHAPDGKRIDIRVEAVGAEAWITVRDQGPGIAPEQVSRLFDRFYRADVSGAGGLGLGPYISRMLADVHGGRNWIESAPSKGSAVTDALPMTRRGESIEVEPRRV